MNESAAPAESPPTPLPRPRRRWWVSLILVLVILAAGFVAGACTTVLVIVQRVRYAAQHPEEMPERVTARLERKLDLTDAQADKVLAILTERQKVLLAIRREVQPRVLAEIDLADQEITAVLDDSQKSKWRRLFTRLQRDWQPALPPATADGQPSDDRQP